jgi:iron complex outermembrane receptor protein
VFARANTGHTFIFFDDMRNAGTQAALDQANLSYLPAYHMFDAGILASIGSNWEVRLSATNLSNELGLTEGNSRLTGAQSSGPINAGPMFGRAVKASLLYRF